MDFKGLLKLMQDRKGSDLYITAHLPPSMRVDGRVVPVTERPLSAEQAREVVQHVMNAQQLEEFNTHHEANFAIAVKDLGRFRVSAFLQRGMPGMVIRRLETTIPNLEDLHLPEVIGDLALTKRGLVIFVGGTGAGKSSSLAAMIGYRNQVQEGHIICIEDPIEFVHTHRKSIVTQREVGIDTESFETALKNTLRQAPDVIMIGEVRSRETMEHAITFAETGHLCLCTLHANNANQALDRIINFFPEERRSQLLLDLSLNLRAVVAQQLVPRKDGEGRRAAVEVMLNTPYISDLIYKGEISQIKEAMTKTTDSGMQTFDQALFQLYRDGEISEEDALRHADSPNDLRLMIKLDDRQGGGELGGNLSGVTLSTSDD